MSTSDSSSVIYVVATPIGNLEDLTPRALRILRECDLVACEDTRVSRKLLSHYGIQGKNLVVYADPTEQRNAEYLIEKLQSSGLSVALITDAGTPCISDPGFRLIQAAREHGIKVVPIPGVSAPVTLASVAGLPTDRWCFVGFLPNKAKALNDEINTWAAIRGSIIFFESARRLETSLAAIAKIYPKATVCVGRELTKVFEDIVTLPVEEALQWSSTHEQLRGEVCVMVHLGATAGDAADTFASIEDDARAELKAGSSLKDLLKKYANSGLSRSELYQQLLAWKNDL